MKRLALFIALSLAITAEAHHDVKAAVAALTKKLETAPSAELYYQRALEYRALRQKDHVEKDLRSALALQLHAPSLKALAVLLSDQGKHLEAIQKGKQLLQLSPAPANHLTLADLHFAAGHAQEALQHVKQGPEGEDHTHLLHAHLLTEAGQAAEAVDLLQKAHQRTKSIVLRNAWLDVAVVDGRYQEVLPILNEEINTSRFSASHRIRRARLLQKKDPQAASADLAAALAELKRRINPQRPDLTLIYDRGLALALLGKKEAARKDLVLLEKSTISPLNYALLKRVLASQK